MILLTGVAGFIGMHVAERLLDEGADVLGVDSINAYYDPALKRARLARLERRRNFKFAAIDIADPQALAAAVPKEALAGIVHLAAQAGVRYSLEAPFAYEQSNLKGHLAILELARAAPKLRHLVYASSSSVYGDRTDGPFRETDRCDAPRSLYAATKRAGELMSEAYAHLHGLRQTGLRFFTVYGPWGRPDMAYWTFTRDILERKPIKLFAGGRLLRDFTYIDDVAPTVAKILHIPPADAPHEIYNLGNSRPVMVLDLMRMIERTLGVEAIWEPADLVKTEVAATFADHAKATAAFGFDPVTTIETGIPRFIDWYRNYCRA
jgi:UDP-glucuronate 4-epimerase